MSGFWKSRYALAGLALFVAGCSSTNNNPSSEAEAPCGIERWNVKILTDAATADINWTPVSTTIAQQNSFPEVKVSQDTTRMAFEEQAVTMSATIVAFKREDDQDIHLVLIDTSGDSMVAEIPGTKCAEVAASPFASEFDNAASWVAVHLGTPPTSDFKHVNANVTITGVLFQDFVHDVTGHARNYREVHPVTKIE